MKNNLLFILIIGVILVLVLNSTPKKNKNDSKVLEEVKKSNKYNAKYLDEYKVIEYQEEANFINNINTFLNKGYKGEEINNIFKLSTKNQTKMLSLDKQYGFVKFIGIKNFDINKLDRYKKYLTTHNSTLANAVTYVNIDLDKNFYTDSILISPQNELTTIVNKYYRLDANYVPENLVVLFDSKNGAKMVKEAANAFKILIEAALKDGITLESTTAYRSYSFQSTLYNNYVKKEGVELADTYSARPGFSEHQLGLAVDLNDPNYKPARLNDKDYDWLKNNAYKYGFILRYTKEGEAITGYKEENWHLRYLGVELATKVTESNLTYEEYYDLNIREY